MIGKNIFRGTEIDRNKEFATYTIDEFKEQLPNKEFNGVETKVLVEDKIKDERGTRFLLIGEIR